MTGTADHERQALLHYFTAEELACLSEEELQMLAADEELADIPPGEPTLSVEDYRTRLRETLRKSSTSK